MSVLVVVTHPRKDSLTHAVARKFTRGLQEVDESFELLDLYDAGFNPALTEADEPDWDNPDKVYSAAARFEMDRVSRHDLLAFVFPVWWYGLPAMAKGYIDVVFNHGFAYGNHHLHHRKLLWIAVAGEPQSTYEARGYIETMQTQLNVGIGRYCGIADSRVEFLFNTMYATEDEIAGLLRDAHRIGVEFPH